MLPAAAWPQMKRAARKSKAEGGGGKKGKQKVGMDTFSAAQVVLAEKEWFIKAHVVGFQC
eukprot:scaffold117985_cov10-Tisochrysis_lutea.AAC.1